MPNRILDVKTNFLQNFYQNFNSNFEIFPNLEYLDISINRLNFIPEIFSKIKKFKDLPGMLTDKKEDLNKYISSMKMTGKTDQDYTDLITYYNQISAK